MVCLSIDHEFLQIVQASEILPKKNHCLENGKNDVCKAIATTTTQTALQHNRTFCDDKHYHYHT